MWHRRVPARERAGCPVACLLFGAAAWQCVDRDQHIGWDATTRAPRLHLITNNTRCLIVPRVDSPCLDSHALGRVQRRIGSDWQRKYGHPIDLLETFVERDRFAGTCYPAANLHPEPTQPCGIPYSQNGWTKNACNARNPVQFLHNTFSK